MAEILASIGPMNKTVLSKLQKRGVRATIAKHFGISYQAVDQWLDKHSIPAERVLGVEQITGVARHELRPDLYPRDAA